MYDKSTAREHLKDLVDTAAVGSGIHVESVEPGVIDTFLDLMQLRVVVAQIGEAKCCRGLGPVGNAPGLPPRSGHVCRSRARASMATAPVTSHRFRPRRLSSALASTARIVS